MASCSLAFCQFEIREPLDHILLGFIYLGSGVLVSPVRTGFDHTLTDHVRRLGEDWDNLFCVQYPFFPDLEGLSWGDPPFHLARFVEDRRSGDFEGVAYVSIVNGIRLHL